MAHSLLLIFTLIAALLNPIFPQSTCPACDCRVSRPPVLDQIITAKIDRILNGQPIVRTLRVFSDANRMVYLYRSNSTTLLLSNQMELGRLSLRNPTVGVNSQTNLFAYRPMFSGNHQSRLGVMFINIEGIFPCVANTDYNAICRTFTDEDDGFRGGRAIIDSGDDGNTFRTVFSPTTETYGFAFQGCPYFNTTCFPSFHSFSIVCHLPATCDPY